MQGLFGVHKRLNPPPPPGGFFIDSETAVDAPSCLRRLPPRRQRLRGNGQPQRPERHSKGDGYGPFPDFSAYTAALPANCRGGFYALKSDGSVITFAGTSNKLYKLSNIDFTWT
jgi:hypothetical protein